MRFRCTLIAAGLTLLPLTALGRDRPVVVEMFTSQGCSSCPPAEALLVEYAERPDVLALGFHVTYWNRLGWRDGYSFEGATQRQEAYAGQLGTDAPFTPEIVVDGRRSVIGSRRDAVAAAIAEAAGDRTGNAEVALSRDKDRLAIRVGAGQGSARVLLVGFDRSHVTPIRRGENRGRTVTQANVVRSIRTLGTWTGAARSFDTPPPVGEEAAVLIQASSGRIVGVARLPRS